MTYAPQTLLALATYLKPHGVTNDGIVGNVAHTYGYHLGRDRIFTIPPGQGAADYSIRQARDKAGLTDAAMAIDIRLAPSDMQALSNWLVAQCIAGAADTLDMSEIIWSPDGTAVLRWSRETGKTEPNGDTSHRGHTHLGYYRDSETQDKTPLFRRYYDGGDMASFTTKAEDWTPTTGAAGASNGVLRATPDTSAPVVTRLPVGTVLRTIGEVATNAATDNDWRATRDDQGRTLFALRRDWNPLVPGGDPAVNATYQTFIDRKPLTDPAALETARKAGYAQGVTAVQTAANAVKPI